MAGARRGDQVSAAAKGVNVLERASQVHFMSEVQNLLDFPPAPKLDLFGKDLGDFSLETVEMFHRDAKSAGYEL